MNSPVAVETVLQRDGPRVDPDSLVSVAVSLYNYARFLPECLDSVAAQRHAALELIVVDDCSTKDDSLQVARDWLDAHAGRFARILLLRHKRNQGLAQARNTAFNAARGTCVFVLDADNMIYPRAVSRLHRVMQAEPVAASYTQLEFFGQQTRLGYADVWDPQQLRLRNYIDAMALVRKRAWHDVGGYTHLEGGWEDYDFWCKFVDQGLIATFVPEILCRYRVHGASMLNTEHHEHSAKLAVQMMLRHPWLRLGER